MASIFRRGRQYWGRVQHKGRELRQPLKTTSGAVARKRFRQWLDRLDSIAWGDAPRRFFDDAMVRFIDEHLPTLKPRSAQRYLVSIANLTGSFEGKLIDELTSAAFADFESARRKAGVKPPTIRRDFACLSSMFGCCIDWEWCDFNPVPAYLRRRKKRGGLKESPARTRYLSHAEEAAILAAAAPTVAQAIAFAIDTGLRKEEQFSLRRKQLGNLTRVRVLGSTSKNARSREVPLLPRAAETVGRLPLHLKTDYVWVNTQRYDKTTGELMPASRYLTLDRGLKAACRRAKVEDVRWHDLRRTCGCRLLQDHGLSMEEVSKWLGHSSVQVTEKIYAFLEIDHLERAVDASLQRRLASAQKSAQGTADS